MKETYTIPEIERENVLKILARYQKKAMAYGTSLTVDVAEMNLLTSWENDYGYTFLYKIVDVLGNVLIWYSSKCVDPMKHLMASIKSHSERDGVRQTIVTRCAAVA